MENDLEHYSALVEKHAARFKKAVAFEFTPKPSPGSCDYYLGLYGGTPQANYGTSYHASALQTYARLAWRAAQDLLQREI